jgi:hypothetical protein
MYEIFIRDIEQCLQKNMDAVYNTKKRKFIDLYLVAPDKDLGGTLDFSKVSERLKYPVTIRKLS